MATEHSRRLSCHQAAGPSPGPRTGNPARQRTCGNNPRLGGTAHRRGDLAFPRNPSLETASEFEADETRRAFFENALKQRLRAGDRPVLEQPPGHGRAVAGFGAGWFLASGMIDEGDTLFHVVMPGVFGIVTGWTLVHGKQLLRKFNYLVFGGSSPGERGPTGPQPIKPDV